ncbi:MAG TPA: sugar ABC transporter ATP-binding protein [Solirubrobacter sp.]|nr:sugar ABC transporter ATP-binding protein [Solirubrobacter sp.]
MTALLELAGVSKRFGGAHALAEVDLRIEPGEVHGLLGQNGSGKSTLLKVLSGFHEPDAGTLTVRGDAVPLPLAPGAFRALGFAFVHQDLALVPSLSVTENLIVSRLAGGGRIRWRSENARAAAVLDAYGLDGIDPKEPVARLTQMQRALVAVVRAIEELRADGHDSPLLVLDEPTAFLPRVGIERLFALVRDVVAGGGSVLFVTHDLDEVRELCDRMTVLRDGRVAGTADVAGTSVDDLVEMIIGHRLERRSIQRREAGDGPVALRARGVTGGIVRGIDLDVAAGEVVGVTGLLGSGFEELVHVLFGARPGTGVLEVGDEAVNLSSLVPRRAIELGMGFVPADRPQEAAIGSLSVAENVTMTTLREHRGRAGLSRGALRSAAADLGERYAVVPNRPELALQALSGGNQQKAILGKWLQTEPPILLLDQPTQGVDVRAREQIIGAVRAAAARGTAVVCASADYEELAGLCDRVLVLARGRLALELSGEELTKERIAEQVLTSTSAGDALALN